MNTRYLLVFLVLVLSACQPAQILPTVTASIAPPTHIPASTNTPVPPTATNTPIPPTATNTPFIPKAMFKIAVHVPRTGDMGNNGTEIFHGSELAVSQLSGPLELMGYAVQLVSYDDMGDLDTTVRNAKDLVKDANILCGVGHFTSRQMILASEVYHQAGLAFISPSSTKKEVTDRGYLEVNRISGRDDMQGAASARFAQERGFKAIYLIHNQGEFIQQIADGFKREADQLGLTIVGRLPTDITSGFEGAIRSILAVNTDLVYFVGGTDQVGTFINEARKAGYSGAVLSIDLTPDVLNYAGPFATDGGGVYYTTMGASLASLTDVAQFVIDFQSRYGAEPQSLSSYAYDATGICLKAIEEASKAKGGEIPTRVEVAKAIRALMDYKGITGTYNFTSKGDPTISIYQTFQITTIDPGNWDANPVVATYEMEPPGN